MKELVCSSILEDRKTSGMAGVDPGCGRFCAILMFEELYGGGSVGQVLMDGRGMNWKGRFWRRPRNVLPKAGSASIINFISTRVPSQIHLLSSYRKQFHLVWAFL